MSLGLPKVVAFDVIDTLFSIDEFRPLFNKVGLSSSALSLWLTRIARDGACLSLADTYRTYEQVARAALLQVAVSDGIKLSMEDLYEIMSGFKKLKPYPDAYFTLKALSDQNVRVVMLTNTSAELAKYLLVEHDFDCFVHKIISIDEIRVWKPCRGVYEHAARLLAVPPSEMAMVSAYAWDINGAKSAGLIGAWVTTSEKHYSQSFLAPDIVDDSLNGAYTRMIDMTPSPEQDGKAPVHKIA